MIKLEIYRSEHNHPAVFIILPGHEREGNNSLLREIREDADEALICVKVDQIDRSFPRANQPNPSDHNQLQNGINIANFIKKNTIRSPLTRVVLLFGSEFPTYLFQSELSEVSKDGIYYIAYQDLLFNHHTVNGIADDIRNIICNNMLHYDRDANESDKASLLSKQAINIQEAPRDKKELLECFQKMPSTTHNSEIKIYYTDIYDTNVS